METKCSKCGASLQYTPGTKELHCPYCGNIFTISSSIAEQEISADYIIPFSANKDEIVTAFRVYLTQGLTTPDDLIEKASISDISLLYYPAYYEQGSYHTSWTASFGFDHDEVTRVYNTLTKRYEDKVHTVTEWQPMSGNFDNNFSLLSPASEDILEDSQDDHHLESLTNCIISTPTNNIVEFDHQYTVGFNSVEFSINNSNAWDKFGNPQLQNDITNCVYKNAQGDHQENWNWTTKINFENTFKIFVPIAKVKFEYNKETYIVFINGTNTSYAYGLLPEDQHKVNLEIEARKTKNTAFIPLLISLASIIASLFLSDTSINALLCFISLAIASVYLIYTKYLIKSELAKWHENSEAIRNALLIQKEAQDGKLSEADNNAVAESFTIPPSYTPNLKLNTLILIIACIVSAAVPFSKDISNKLSSQADNLPSNSSQYAYNHPHKNTLNEDYSLSTTAWFNKYFMLNQMSSDQIEKSLNFLYNEKKKYVSEHVDLSSKMANVNTYIQQKDFIKAADLLSKLTKEYPTDGYTRGNYAYVLYKMHKYNDSIYEAETALKLEPQHINAWRLLSANCYRLNNTNCVNNINKTIELINKQQQ